jgi:glycosyltransferase involved in cell wall biosynthesis
MSRVTVLPQPTATTTVFEPLAFKTAAVRCSVVRIQSRICVGGPALNAILLAEALSHRHGSRYDTTLVGGALEPGEMSMESFARSRGVAIHLVPEMQRPVSPAMDIKALARIVSILRRVRPVVVHTHTAKAGAIGRIAARLVRVPVVVHTFHGHVFEGYFGRSTAQAFVTTERLLARLSDAVVAISERQRAELVHQYAIAPSEKVRLVPLGLELDRFRRIKRKNRGELRRELGTGAKDPIILAVGRVVPVKRYDVLIDAFAEFAHTRPDAHLVLAGDGDPVLRSDLARQARPTPHIHFLGWRRDLERLYTDADVLALTSDTEGTPVAVIEAIASGVPVVATQVGGVEDIITPGMGILVQRGSSRAVAAALTSLLKRPVAVPDDLRDDIIRRFSHRRLISDIAALYDELLAAKLPHGLPAGSSHPAGAVSTEASRC